MKKFQIGGSANIDFRFAPTEWIIGIAIAKRLGIVFGLGPFHLEIWFNKL